VESQVCVQQTALDLLEKDIMSLWQLDCISSRQNSDKKNALKRMAQAGEPS